ncbi:FAD-dependent oxidoreductase [bacterium]|nr:FAD-dependent oxidoreductase [bacterium]
MRVIIIGGDAAGLKTAARLRRLQPDTEIIVFEQSDVVSYAACGLPYFLSGDIDRFDELVETAWGELKDADYFKRTKNIDVHLNSRVENIDPASKKIRLASTANHQIKEWDYDKLVIATGASPTSLEIPGCELDEVSCFTRPAEAKKLRRALETNEIGRVAILGAGYIGLELCEAFGALWGVEVELIEKEDYPLPRMLDPEMAYLVEKHLKEQGVNCHFGRTINSIRKKESHLSVHLNNAEEIQVDRVLLALGVKPNVQLALMSDGSQKIKLGPHGGILVDSHGCTSDPDIYAAGDCCGMPSQRGHRILPLGSIANRMGRVVADNIHGLDSSFPRVLGSAVVKVFDLNIAVTGKPAKRMEAVDRSVKEYWGNFPVEAHYYPDSQDVWMKMVTEINDRLAGLQVIGKGEVVRWVDAFSLILELAGGDPSALQKFEHAYAPPYATAMDPLHHLGAMISNGSNLQLNPSLLRDGGNADWTWINLMSKEEKAAIELPFLRGRMIEMDMGELRSRYEELPEKKLIALCAKGPRSYEATIFLRSKGYECSYIAGGVAYL